MQSRRAHVVECLASAGLMENQCAVVSSMVALTPPMDPGLVAKDRHCPCLLPQYLAALVV